MLHEPRDPGRHERLQEARRPLAMVRDGRLLGVADEVADIV
jgi:hypothetical protein